jgi:release factor glutamine methyltransferase
MEFTVTPDVLIPRPETECLVETALRLFTSMPGNGARRILEMGTGSGAIILSLCKHLSDVQAFASDISYNALKIARANAVQHGLETQAHFFCGNWLEALIEEGEGFHLILSNPPYIRSRDMCGLQPEIRLFEPVHALDGGQDGLSAIRHLIRTGPSLLVEDGWLLLEIGHDQSEEVEKEAEQTGFYQDIGFEKDFAGHQRVAVLKRKPA